MYWVVRPVAESGLSG
jgi:hypothetical protein